MSTHESVNSYKDSKKNTLFIISSRSCERNPLYLQPISTFGVMRKKFFITIWAVFFAVILFVVIAFWAIAKGYIGYMPDLNQLENPVNKFASQVLTADGKLLGTWSYQRANRIFVDYNDIAPSTIQALVATEDVRFYDHSGIDFKALMRAVVKRGFMRQKNAGGGSTITQQLAKQLYSETAHSTTERLLQKPIEWVIAVQLERFYTKEERIRDERSFGGAKKQYRNRMKKNASDPVSVDICSFAELRRINPGDMKYDSFLMLAIPKILKRIKEEDK